MSSAPVKIDSIRMIVVPHSDFADSTNGGPQASVRAMALEALIARAR